MNSLSRSRSASKPEHVVRPSYGNLERMSPEERAEYTADIPTEEDMKFDSPAVKKAMRTERRRVYREVARLASMRPPSRRVRQVASVPRARETRRAPARPSTTRAKADGSDPPAPSDDGPPEPPRLALFLAQPVDPRAVVRGALLGAVAAAEAALAAYDASFPPVDPIVILRDGCAELGLSPRMTLDAHRDGAFVASGRPLRARLSAIRTWYEARLEPPPAPVVATPAMDHDVDDDDGVHVRSRLRSITGGRK